MVQVNESIKCIVPKYIVGIEFTNNQFNNLFDIVILKVYGNKKELRGEIDWLDVEYKVENLSKIRLEL